MFYEYWIPMYHVKPQLNNKTALIHKYFNSSVKLLIVFSSLEMLNKFYEHLYSMIYSCILEWEMSEDEYEYEDYEEGWDKNALPLEYTTIIVFSEEDEYENEEEIKEHIVESEHTEEEEEEEEEEKGNYDEIEWVLTTSF